LAWLRVDPVDEDQARIPCLPGRLHDALEDLPRPLPAGGLLGVRVHQVVLAVAGQGLHEGVHRGHGDVEVADPAVQLALDEFQDVGVIHLEDAHVGAAARPALLHGLGGAVEHLEEADRAAGLAPGGVDQAILGPEAREGEARPAPLLWMMAARLTASKISSIESPTGRTKQAEYWRPLFLPAFISVGELGRNTPSTIIS